MANPTVLDWLDENSLRSFPLKESAKKTSGAYTIPTNLLLDAVFVYTAHPGNSYLTNIYCLGDIVTFTFTGGLVFTASKADPYPQYLRNSDGSLLVVGEGLEDVPAGSHNFTTLGVENSLIYEFGGAWLGVSSLTFDPNDPLIGDIRLYEGFNFLVKTSPTILSLGVDGLYGLQMSCEHFGEVDNDCDDIISWINGVGPDGDDELKIVAGDGVVVWDDPEHYRIYVGFQFNSVADVCKDIPPHPL